MKIALVVDDEPLLRRQVAEALENYGFDQIIEAENGQQALELALARRPLLVVMDVSMPVMDGVTAAEKISSQAPMPIVLLTGNKDSETLDRARAAGVMSYLVKPFNQDQAIPAIDLAIHHFIKESQLREEVESLKETLETRKLIEKAKGLLMQKGISEPEAYRRMQKTAMDKRKSLRQVAEAILLMEG